MAAAALRKSGKSRPSTSSNQSWSPSSGQVTKGSSQSLAGVFVSEHDQQPPVATSCCDSHEMSRLACRLSQPFLLDQPQGGSGQYQPSGKKTDSSRYGCLFQYQPAGNDQTPLAGEGLNSTAFVDAQLTTPISRDDEAERQDAPCDDDAPMPDAPTVHDFARRQIGGRCRKWWVHQHTANFRQTQVRCLLYVRSAIQPRGSTTSTVEQP